jgi:ribosomal protein S12 methylthiotransferase
VEELMLTQQKIAFAKAKEKIGQTIEVLIDSREKEDIWIARSAGQAPEIDSVTRVHSNNLHAGKLLRVKVTASAGYDLAASPAKPSARSLAVVREA